MLPASRTPEGRPFQCPVCGQRSWLDPSSYPVEDVPCPHCGCLFCFEVLPPSLRTPMPAPHGLPDRSRLLGQDLSWKGEDAWEDEYSWEDHSLQEQPSDRDLFTLWIVVAPITTFLVWLNDGSSLLAATWLLLLFAIGGLLLPAFLRCSRRWRWVEDRLLLGVPLACALIPGLPVGAFFGTLLPWAYGWEVNSFVGGLVGLVVGAALVAVQAALLLLLIGGIAWFVSGRRLLASLLLALCLSRWWRAHEIRPL